MAHGAAESVIRDADEDGDRDGDHDDDDRVRHRRPRLRPGDMLELFPNMP